MTRSRLNKLLSSFMILLAILGWHISCRALTGDTDENFNIDGSIRNIISFIDYSGLTSGYTKGIDHDFPVSTILRLTSEGQPKENISYEIHLVQDLQSPPPKEMGMGSDAPQARYKAIDASCDWHEGSNTASLRLDRLNLRYSLPWSDLTIGRQAITFGKAYFWNPLDIFHPFEPHQLDRDYKPGVDGIRMDIPLDLFSGINLISVFGPDITTSGSSPPEDGIWNSSTQGSAFFGRAYTLLSDWDLTVQAGKIYGGYHIGAGAVGEIGWMETRLEASWFKPSSGITAFMPPPYQGDLMEEHRAAVIGIGHRFHNSLTFEVEYLFNGAADPCDLGSSAFRQVHGASMQMSRKLLGVMSSYEFLPIVTGQMVWIYSISDHSLLSQPVLFISLADEIDLILGAAISSGKRPDVPPLPQLPKLRSEFGSYPDTFFLEFKYYFRAH